MTNKTYPFDGLAFPVARVRYSNGKWSASIYRDRDQTYRARLSYDHAIGAGARGARVAALAAFDKALADTNGLAASGDYIAVPGDFDANTYVFTFVPTELLKS